MKTIKRSVTLLFAIVTSYAASAQLNLGMRSTTQLATRVSANTMSATNASDAAVRTSQRSVNTVKGKTAESKTQLVSVTETSKQKVNASASSASNTVNNAGRANADINSSAGAAVNTQAAAESQHATVNTNAEVGIKQATLAAPAVENPTPKTMEVIDETKAKSKSVITNEVKEVKQDASKLKSKTNGSASGELKANSTTTISKQ